MPSIDRACNWTSGGEAPCVSGAAPGPFGLIAPGVVGFNGICAGGLRPKGTVRSTCVCAQQEAASNVLPARRSLAARELRLRCVVLRLPLIGHLRLVQLSSIVYLEVLFFFLVAGGVLADLVWGGGTHSHDGGTPWKEE